MNSKQRQLRAKELLKEFCDDIKNTYGQMGEGYRHMDILDEEELDWPDLAETYKKAKEFLQHNKE